MWGLSGHRQLKRAPAQTAQQVVEKEIVEPVEVPPEEPAFQNLSLIANNEFKDFPRENHSSKSSPTTVAPFSSAPYDLDFDNKKLDFATGDNVAAATIEDPDAQPSNHRAALDDESPAHGNTRADILQLKEIIRQRERALESSTVALSELTRTCDEKSEKLSELQLELIRKDKIHASKQSDMNSNTPLAKLHEQIALKEARIQDIESEGKILAAKFSEMEKLVRKSKVDVKEKDSEVLKMKESKDQLVQVIQETQEVLKKKENKISGLQKTLSNVQTSHQVSTDRIKVLEADVALKVEELSVQKDLLLGKQKEFLTLKQELDDLKLTVSEESKSLGEEADRVELRRELEQRELVLQATNEQLQESLRQYMLDAGFREERLREETNDMQMRWQECIRSKEKLSSEFSDATAPLLRQISTLQDNFRVKSEQWKTMEREYSENALRQVHMADMTERKKLLLEEDLREQTLKTDKLIRNAGEQQIEIADLRRIVDEAREDKEVLMDKVKQLESRVTLEVEHERRITSTTLKEQEQQHRSDLIRLKLEWEEEYRNSHGSKGTHNDASALIAGYKMDILRLEKALMEVKGHGGLGTPLKKVLPNSPMQGSPPPAPVSIGELLLSDGGAAEGLLGAHARPEETTEEEQQSMVLQLQQLQSARVALLDEVSYLSSKLAQLEEQYSFVGDISAENDVLHKRNEALLNLLGEKTEELEMSVEDIKNVKYLYRHHLDELLDQIAPQTQTPADREAAGHAKPASTTPAVRVCDTCVIPSEEMPESVMAVTAGGLHSAPPGGEPPIRLVVNHVHTDPVFVRNDVIDSLAGRPF